MEQEIIWKNETRKVSELIPSDYNPRKLSDEQKGQIKKSLEKFNLADPIIINLDNKIIGGHQRIKVLLELGVEEIDVRVPNRQLTEEEEKELNLRLNKNTGEWDLGKLIDFDKEFLKIIGFSDNELSGLFNEQEEENKNTRTIVFTVSKEEEIFIRECLEKEKFNPHLISSGKRLKQSEILCSILKAWSEIKKE
jgi:ParB-like chromosome segregation protein Spo0J